jgi:Cellulose binding domain
MATQAQARSISSAVRRTVVTPTFAAGLGVVIAAVLAVTFPLANVISFGDGPQAGGSPCPVEGCRSTAGGGAAEPASVKPGRKLVTPAPARPKAHASTAAPSGARPGGGKGTPPPGGAAVQYQTVDQWHDGFVEEIVVSPTAGSPADWRLLLTYSSAHIVNVGGARWTLQGEHSVLLQPESTAGQPPGGGGSFRIYVVVTGSPGPPSGCSFDGQACRNG